MDTFPDIERTGDGWYSQRWQVVVSEKLPVDVESLARNLREHTLVALSEWWADRGEVRSDPVDVLFSSTDGQTVQIVITVRSEHPDWRMGAILATLQEMDRRFRFTHVQGRPRSKLPPWYLSREREGAG